MNDVPRLQRTFTQIVVLDFSLILSSLLQQKNSEL